MHFFRACGVHFKKYCHLKNPGHSITTTTIITTVTTTISLPHHRHYHNMTTTVSLPSLPQYHYHTTVSLPQSTTINRPLGDHYYVELRTERTTLPGVGTAAHGVSPQTHTLSLAHTHSHICSCLGTAAPGAPPNTHLQQLVLQLQDLSLRLQLCHMPT